MTPDANGILYLEETDPITPFQTTINTLQAATSEAIEDYTANAPKSQVFTPDVGFPVTIAGVTTGESAATNRITISAVPYARTLTIVASVPLRYSQAASVEAMLYIGGAVICRTRISSAINVYNTHSLMAGRDLPANQSAVIETRFQRQAGTGAVDSVNGSLNTLYVIASPA